MIKVFSGNLDFMFILQAIVEHLEQQDVEAFTETVKEYDSICRLDSW